VILLAQPCDNRCVDALISDPSHGAWLSTQ
jgi:hypothetical protein